MSKDEEKRFISILVKFLHECFYHHGFHFKKRWSSWLARRPSKLALHVYRLLTPLILGF